jgi:hypothetical protein
MSEILFRNFQLLVCCGLLHQLPVPEISDAFGHSVVCFYGATCLQIPKKIPPDPAIFSPGRKI